MCNLALWVFSVVIESRLIGKTLKWLSKLKQTHRFQTVISHSDMKWPPRTNVGRRTFGAHSWIATIHELKKKHNVHSRLINNSEEDDKEVDKRETNKRKETSRARWVLSFLLHKQKSILWLPNFHCCWGWTQ